MVRLWDVLQACYFVFHGSFCLLSLWLCRLAWRALTCSKLFCSCFKYYIWIYAISLARQMFMPSCKSKFSSLSILSIVALSCKQITIWSLINSSVSVPNLHDDASLKPIHKFIYTFVRSLCAWIKTISFVHYYTLVFGFK